MSDSPSLRDRYVGCMLGSALGDALGKPTEHIDYDMILHRYGPDGITELPENGLYTDDTQMAMAAARALVAAGSGPSAPLMDAVCAEFLDWYDLQNSPQHRRAPGVAVIDALGRIKRGAPRSVAADGGANDSIVATRNPPVALRYHGDLQRIVETAAEISRMTHGHPTAAAGGAAAALFVEYALTGLAPEEWLGRYVSDLRRWCPDSTAKTIEAIRITERTLGWLPEDALERQFNSRSGYGGGWTAEEVVALGLWCFLATPDDFLMTVRVAANTPGESDTDSIAAMAGALSGAYNGVGALPDDWLARLEDHDEIRALAETLYDVRAQEMDA